MAKRKAPYRGPRKEKDQHKAVVDAYFANGLDRKAALLAAGYSEKTATTNPQSVFDHPWVAAEIARRQAEMRVKSDVTTEQVVDELRKLAFARLGDLLTVQKDGSAILDLSDLTDDQRAAMQEYVVETYNEGRGEDAVPVKKFRVKFGDKKGALELLGRYLGMFKDKLEHSASEDLVMLLQRGRERARKKAVPE